MPEDLPDRMPEDMSDRMPEDLPVRKCINVMVGITRSKVIFAEWIVESLQFGTSRGVTASPKSSRASNRASIPCAHGD